MKEKLVKRYYCEFCRKGMSQRPAMEKHETHCTLNPNRRCKMCIIITGGDEPVPMSELAALLPGEVDHPFSNPVAEALPNLREKVDNCPCCIMAALRQKGLAGYVTTEFDFRKECQAIFDTRREEERYY
jgi:hypothetical protein